MKNKSLKLPIMIIAIGIVIAIATGLLVSVQKAPAITEQDFDFSITYKCFSTGTNVWFRVMLHVKNTEMCLFSNVLSHSYFITLKRPL